MLSSYWVIAMYNQEIKERFLIETSANHKFTSGREAIMEQLGVHEEFLKKDLSEMSVSEVVDAVKNTKIATYNTAASACTLIKNYVKWCEDASLFDNINTELLSIVVDDIDVSGYIGRLFFKNESDFIQALKSARPFDDGYYDVIVMIFAWLGIEQDLAMRIKITDVDFENKAVFLENKQVSFSDPLKEILELYSKTKIGTRLNKNGPREVYRDDSFDWFIRKFSPRSQLGKELTKSQVKSLIHDMNQIYVDLGNEPKFTVGNVLASGAMSRVLQLEQSGVDVFSPKNRAIVVSNHGLNAKPYEITWMYKNYKRAFSL